VKASPVSGSRRHQEIEQIPRMIVPTALPSLDQDLVDERHPPVPEPRPREVVRGTPSDRQEQIEQIGAAKMLIVAREKRAQRLAVLAHLKREHRAARNLQREMLEHGEQVDGFPRHPAQAGKGLARRSRHVRYEKVDRLWGERRCHRAALTPPRLALAEKETLAEKGSENADRGSGTAVDLIVIDEDVSDRVGIVEDKAVAMKEAALDDHLLVGPARPAAQAIGPHCGHEPERGQVLRRRLGVRRDNQIPRERTLDGQNRTSHHGRQLPRVSLNKGNEAPAWYGGRRGHQSLSGIASLSLVAGDVERGTSAYGCLFAVSWGALSGAASAARSIFVSSARCEFAEISHIRLSELIVSRAYLPLRHSSKCAGSTASAKRAS
jgi:hypothetical protein